MVALTEQRKLFIDEYLKLRCKNATQAAINAGYSAKSAQSQASQILNDPKVSEYLEHRKKQIRSDLQQDFIFDALEARKVMYSILKNPESKDARQNQRGKRPVRPCRLQSARESRTDRSVRNLQA